MEIKTARLTLLIDPNKKAAFERLCAQQDLTASQVVRQLIREYLAQHGVQYVPSGLNAGNVEPAGDETVPQAQAQSDAPPAKRRTARRKG
ncbi:ribbon-helix-helix protein, CopG family [Cupriavidus basilensis]|uniref:ribbon-helix-helix protein, CopG family n=1 Tax=Cupriavidus TaxID=106589 RepID=UPI0023E81AFD|nr:ribbon-helix-helix protein, CopG family [Cupriavidus basilensis]MDF3888465.1 ribbon-helix-helix protein, CopG family [Cupriavidus basilensis]